MDRLRINARINIICFLFWTIALQACTQEEEVIVPEEPQIRTFPNVEAELQEYFRRFEEEATLKGLEVDLVKLGITGVINEIDEQHVIGQCSYNRFNPRLVTIDQSFWNRSSDLSREFVVFHELGHCVLNRGHLEDAFSNGACKSIMRSGTGRCFDAYNIRNRDYYVEELFEPAVVAVSFSEFP